MNRLLAALVFASSMASAQEVIIVDKELKLITMDDGSTYQFDDVSNFYVGQEIDIVRPFELPIYDMAEEENYDELEGTQ